MTQVGTVWPDHGISTVAIIGTFNKNLIQWLLNLTAAPRPVVVEIRQVELRTACCSSLVAAALPPRPASRSEAAAITVSQAGSNKSLLEAGPDFLPDLLSYPRLSSSRDAPSRDE
jgi:hypothetical protein